MTPDRKVVHHPGADTGFSERGGGGGDGQGGPLRGGGVIAPVGEKLLFEHTKFSATRGGSPLPPHQIYRSSPVTEGN